MSDFNREEWDDLDPEQRWEAFDAMHQAYHEIEREGLAAEGNAGTLIRCMFDLAQALTEGDVLGKRAETLRTAAISLRVIATKAYLAMPNSLSASEDNRMNLAFDSLAEQLENDPEFNRGAE